MHGQKVKILACIARSRIYLSVGYLRWQYLLSDLLPHLPILPIAIYLLLLSVYLSTSYLPILSAPIYLSTLWLHLGIVPIYLCGTYHTYQYLRFWDLTTFEKRMYVCMYVCMYVSTYLPIYLSTYLPIYLSTYLPIYLPIYLSTYLPTYLYIYLSTYLSMSLSMRLCIYASMCPCMYVSMYLCICTYVSLYLCIYVSLCICEAAVLFAKGAAVCSNPTCFAWMLHFVICPVILAHGPCCESYVWCFSLLLRSMSHCSSSIHVETCMAKKWKS